jgi:hypothetical protein
MDKMLEDRYRILFDAYGTGGRDLVLQTKSRIVQWRSSGPDQLRLRGDAELFLLINFDHMIVRPYIGGILRGTDNNPFVPRYQGLTSAEVRGRIDQALQVIRQHFPLGPRDEPISAHEVLLAIDKSWGTLKSILIWA